ncbi:MAG: hypothetical protein JWQ76_3871, partial [Ramlibacter sp.]|nr:hypothetical protein [Ramlibacter sp.]
GGVDVHSCRECGSCHPVPVTRLGSPVCPVCYLLRPRIAGFRQDFERRMEQRRVQRPSRDMQHASA